MILFNLCCVNAHQFEAWFSDGATYERQIVGGEVLCPMCGSAEVRKAPMAPSLVSGRRQEQTAAELRALLTDLRRHVEATAENVGERFPNEARAMYYGETEERPIYGEASAEETTALREEGVDVVSVPWLRQGS